MPVGSTKVRAFWPWDTAAKPLPAGWTRDSAFDDRFLQGDGASYAGPANAGTASPGHNHSEAGHTHAGNQHVHTVSAAEVVAGGTNANQPTKPPPTFWVARCTHGHDAENSAPTAITYAQTVITVNTADAKPPWVRAIVIQPAGPQNDIPNHAMCFGDDGTLPPGYCKTDGTGGTPNLSGRFVIGAESGGVGGATGGNPSHTHDSPEHTHGVYNHGHASAQCGQATSTTTISSTTTARLVRQPRHHNVTLSTKALADLSTDAPAIQAEGSEPGYVKLMGIQNTSGRATTPAGVILAFVGTTAEIPSTWVLCDGSNGTQDCTDRQVKITTADGEIGYTGGSNSHSHTVDAHGHSHTSGHDHAATQTWQGVPGDAGALTVCGGFMDRHVHSWTVGDTVPTLQTTEITLTSTDKRYQYRTVLWIKKVSVQRKRVTAGSIHKTDEVVIAA